MRKSLFLLILQFGLISPVYSYTVGGYIFEDYDFGGEKRSFNTSLGMVAMHRINVQVRLSNAWGSYDGYTGSDGYFYIYNVSIHMHPFLFFCIYIHIYDDIYCLQLIKVKIEKVYINNVNRSY